VFKPVVVVAADPETQRARIAARDGLSFSEADARIASQLPLSEKLKLADYVIENRGSLADLEARATEVLNAVQAETTQKA
jgi:dephospho-CoA kinase